VETERIAVAVRPREGYEAVDLGFQLARGCWVPLFGAHALVVVPLAIALCAALRNHVLVALAILWWLKPLYDRVALSVLSGALLGRTPGILETLAGLPRLVFASGLFSSLTWLRLSPMRAFAAPILQLEGLRGRARARRARVLGGRQSNAALGLFFACGNFEAVISFAGLQLAATFVPGDTFTEFWWKSLTEPGPGLVWIEAALYVLGVCAIEPLYVAGGFALYINRRVWLEGWDVELAFKRLERRVRALVALAALWVVLAPAPRAHAEPAPRCAVDSAEDARTCIDAVLAEPDFEKSVKVEIWRPRSFGGGIDLDFLGPLWRWMGSLLSNTMRVGAWLAIPGILALLALAIARGLRVRRASDSSGLEGELRRGFDLRPESLPDDVLTTARARFAAGDASAALSLLYRAALVELARRFGLRLPASATEGECERIARRAPDGVLVQDFAALASAWLFCAYAHRPPAPDEFDALCSRWAAGFGART
jgi:hypothetical protein